jgi:hypothetical protein
MHQEAPGEDLKGNVFCPLFDYFFVPETAICDKYQGEYDD